MPPSQEYLLATMHRDVQRGQNPEPSSSSMQNHLGFSDLHRVFDGLFSPPDVPRICHGD